MRFPKFRVGKTASGTSSTMATAYRGSLVKSYEKSRKNNPKWAFEEDTLRTVMNAIDPSEKRIVADIPVGTNRFYQFLDDDPEIKIVHCIDNSVDMLIESMMRTSSKFFYSRCDMIDEGTPIVSDTVISYRFLNLFDFNTIEKILANLCHSSRRNLIMTIRLSESHEESGSVFQNKIHIHSRARFDEALAANDFEPVWEKGYADEKPGEYFTLHARRNGH
ncbi:hypothetical protein [Gymnodinialimonas ulvae]|uniref:hypothetical protein n=1 Tax=Gymnodinialimonas ulvae TaxID=3126504 RepID=UPI0030AF2C10